MDRWGGWFGWLVVLVPVGCGEPDLSPPGFLSRTEPIIYGTPDTNPAHQAVVALTTSYGQLCSGTLITDTVVLTAAHCLDGSVPSQTEIFFGAALSDPTGQRRGVEEWMIFPRYDPTLIEGDLGIIRLSAGAPVGIVPVPYLPADVGLSLADEGAGVEFAGFGLTEWDTFGTKLRVNGTIATVCPGPAACDVGLVAPRAFSYYTELTGGPCFGDSGGPAFLLRETTEYVAGITSYGDAGCASYGASTTTSAYAEWIDSFIAGTGLERCDNNLDDDDDQMIDCDDDDCAYHSFCIRPNACAVPRDLFCGSSVDANTAIGSRVFSTNGCVGDPGLLWRGPELAFRLRVPAGAVVAANLLPLAGDPDVFVLLGDDVSCDIRECVAGSTNAGDEPELLSFRLPPQISYLLVDSIAAPATFRLTVTCTGIAEICSNGYDEDGDGAIDCADSDCAWLAICQPVPEFCHNNYDDDGDGLIDCDDPGCATSSNCVTVIPPPGPDKDRAPYPWEEDGGCSCTGTDDGLGAGSALLFLLARRRRVRLRQLQSE